MISIPEKQIKKEQREFEKLERIIARKDKKALDKWTKRWLRETKREEKRFDKSSKKDYL